MSVRRRVADAPLALLAIVALGLAVGLAFYASIGGPSPRDAFAACESIASTLAARFVALGQVLPLLVVSLAAVAGVAALLHQLHATRHMVRGVLARRLPTGPRVARIARRAGLQGRVTRIDGDEAYAFCYGYVSPRVCLSRGLADLLDDAELEAVLRHEAHHARYRDPLKILVCRTLASALFFLPLAGALRNGYLAGKELCADVDAACGDGFPLARALLKLLDASRPEWPAGVLAIGALSPTEIRLEHLLADDAPRALLPAPADWIATAALVAGLFGFSHGAAAQAATDAPASCGSTAAVAAHVPGTVGEPGF